MSHIGHLTLRQVNAAFEHGSVTESDVQEYLALWNATPGRYSHAFLWDGFIRQHCPEYQAMHCPVCKAVKP